MGTRTSVSLYRDKAGMMVVCLRHLIALRDYKFNEKCGLRVKPIGPRDLFYAAIPPQCILCLTPEVVVETLWGATDPRSGERGARHNHCSHCGTALHPRWPAVYCSNECAWRDA